MQNKDKEISDHATGEKKLYRINLTAALLISILVSLLFVSISYFMYTINPKYKYDLARPDVEKTEGIEKPEAIKEDIDPVDSEIVGNVIDSIKSQLEDIKEVGDFEPQPLSNKALQLKD